MASKKPHWLGPNGTVYEPDGMLADQVTLIDPATKVAEHWKRLNLEQLGYVYVERGE